MAEICPICGEEIALGACPGCGFELPDYSAIAAPYDLDPSNDHFGETDPAEGMFPYIDTSGIANEPEPEYDIPSIALPSIQSLNPAGKLASANVQPAPNIKVRPAVQQIPSLQSVSVPKAAPKSAAKHAVNVHAAPPVQTFQPSRNTPPIQPVQPAQSVPSAPFVPYNAQTAASLPVRIVKGTVNFVIAHWWKFLIMAVAPSAGLLFAGFYVFMYREDRRTADILKAIMFGVLTGVMVFSRWDPFGLDIILREILDAFFSSSRRRRRY
ncbi:MAG: hypothetical protein K2J11_11265 [Oscillospiraceae bacterium]|nr:hypothetical protein [Oscillospiraceae bacterium]